MTLIKSVIFVLCTNSVASVQCFKKFIKVKTSGFLDVSCIVLRGYGYFLTQVRFFSFYPRYKIRMSCFLTYESFCFISFQIEPEMLDTLYKYAKFQYECGNYSGAAEYLYFYRVLVSNLRIYHGNLISYFPDRAKHLTSNLTRQYSCSNKLSLRFELQFAGAVFSLKICLYTS